MITKTIDFGPTKLGRIRQLTEELNAEELAIHLFFKLAPDLFCIADETGYFRTVNNAWKLMLGWTDEELLSRPILEFIHPDDVELTRDIMTRMENQDIIRFHNRIRRKIGSINRINDPEGLPAGEEEYVVLEWSATAWHNQLTYAVARQVPVSCLLCPDAQERFGWLHRSNRINGTKRHNK